jgi:hypothetical protein
MTDADFLYAPRCEFDLTHEFHANRAAGRHQLDVMEYGTADESEVAIDIANGNSEQESRKSVVGPANPDTMRRVASLPFVAVVPSDIRRHALEQFR